MSNDQGYFGSKHKNRFGKNDAASSLEPMLLGDVSTKQKYRGLGLDREENGENESGNKQVFRKTPRKISRFTYKHIIFISCLISLSFIVITTFAPYPIGLLQPSEEIATSEFSSGCKGNIDRCICPRRTVCADSLVYMNFLAISRSCAYFCYPLYIILFLTKAHNLCTFLQNSVLSLCINFTELHLVHTWAGIIVSFAGSAHGFLHIIRWYIRDGDITLLSNSQTGITGLLALVITPLITWPMMFPKLKKNIAWEWRKGLHYLSVVWGIALMFHAPACNIFWILGTPVIIYITDWLIGMFGKCYLIRSTYFRRLETCCEMTFKHPTGFKFNGGDYILVLLPWISKREWHTFSLFPSKNDPYGSSSICIAVAGDWTRMLHSSISTPTRRAAWICGPFSSPFATAIDYDNIIAVASGIGITPAIALIRNLSDSRRINLVWICRDACLIEFYLQNIEFDNDAFALIYYTGKQSLILPKRLPANVFVFKGRPNLEGVITGIIYDIESGAGLPEEMEHEGRVLETVPIDIRFRIALQRLLNVYSSEEIFRAAIEASQSPHLNRNAVRRDGLRSAIINLSGTDEFSMEEIDNLFDSVDINGEGEIYNIEFTKFLSLLHDFLGDENTSNMTDGIGGSKRRKESSKRFCNMTPLSDRNGQARKYVSEKKDELQTWQVLYCGGAAQVSASLMDIKSKYGLSFKMESFDW